MTATNYTIRTMNRHEVHMAVDWAAAEGWNPGLDDAHCFHAADPEGFLVGLADQEPVSCISAIRYGRDFGFLGFHIVKPEHRGKGYGLRIWKAGIERLKGRVLGLNGVVAQQDNYKKSGFTLSCRNIRKQGTGGLEALIPPDDASRMEELSSLPFSSVAAYDHAFFPDSREEFLRCWINRKNNRALGLIHDGELAGYGVIRHCRIGHKIGPLFANTRGQAEMLLLALIAHLEPDEPYFLDIPEKNSAAVELADLFGMTTVFETARMYKGAEPELSIDRSFGVTSFELG